MEHGLTTFFDGINQSKRFQGKEIFLDPLVLRAREPALRNVQGNTGEMCGCSLAFDRASIAITASKLLLLLNRTYGRVHLDRFLELVVESLAEVLDEVAGPWLTVAA